MRRAIETVVLTIDPLRDPQDALALAIPLCEKSGARLFVHTSLSDSIPAFLGMGWMRAEEHWADDRKSSAAAHALLARTLEAIPPAIRGDAGATRGPRVAGALELARTMSADLAIVAGEDPKDHADWSSAGGSISSAPCPIVVLPESRSARARLFDGGADAPVLVPVDFSEASIGALRYAIALAEKLPLALELVHVEHEHAWSDVAHATNGGAAAHRVERVEAAEQRLRGLVPESALTGVKVAIRVGSPARRILECADELGARAIILGIRHKNPLERLLLGAASSEILRESTCPVWCVPIGVG